MKYLKEFSTNAEYEAYINGNPDLPNVSLIDEDESVKYNEYVDYSKQYLTFTALEDGTFSFNTTGLSYSLDEGKTWATLASNTNTPTVHTGEKIMWKGVKSLGSYNFSSTGRFNVEGNVMSILFGDNFVGQTSLSGKNNAFAALFRTNNNIISAKNLILPATTLSENCYASMFNNCTSLTTAPSVLPATTLANSCYQEMFISCTSLVKAPELPAKTLVYNCYREMFNFCKKLNYVKMLATDVSASLCLLDWLNNVSATGTFVKASSATLPTGGSGIPSGWTVINE